MARSTERSSDPDLPPAGTGHHGPAPARPPSRRRSKQPASQAGEPTGGAREIILVGCGAIAQQVYAPALHALEAHGALRVRAIVEASESAREWCDQAWPQVTPVASFESVAVAPDALALLTTPVRFHATQAASALKRGWHVLCANPFAMNANEGAQMIATAERHERLLAVDLAWRFFPAARYLRTLCRDHLLGPLINFRIHEGVPRREPEASPTTEKFESPDGVLSELGGPTLDLLTWCLGNAAVRSYADDAMGGVEANAFVELSFAEGVRGTVHFSRDWPTDQSYTFVFERGVVRWHSPQPNRLHLHLASTPFALAGELEPPLVPTRSGLGAANLASPPDAMIAQLQHMLAAIAGRESLRVSGAEAMPALSLVDACYARRTPLPQPWLAQSEAVQARASAPPMALRRS